MKRILTIALTIFFAAATALAAAYRPEDVENVHTADRTKYVSNPDGILSSRAVDSLNRMLGNVWATTSAEPVVVAISDMAEGYDVNRFATELFELWGIGKKDTENGLLVLIVGNTRQYVVRTGRGLGGVLPDVTCSRIMRKEAVPLFKAGDMDGGVLAAVGKMSAALTDPKAAEEIRSAYSSDRGGEEMDFFSFVLFAGALAGIGSLIWIIWIIASSRKDEEQERYRKLNNARPVVLFLSFLGVGMPLPAYLLCVWKMKRLRDHARNCPNCGHAMRKLDERTDNDYLTPAQDLEEQLNSIDYDVWLCDVCGEKDVIPYVNRQSAYTVCSNCGARTCTLTGNRIIKQPTQRSEGNGVRIYSCRNCGKQTMKPYSIAKLASAAPVVFFPGGLGGGGGFGGGGISGGSFGGGGTSGGGASGGW